MTAQKPSLWIRLLSLIPLAVWFPFARLLAWLSWRYIERPFLALKTEPGTPLGRALRLAPESARVRA